MEEDISKNTLLVLVALTIVISVLGTWTVIHEASQVRTVNEPAVGQVSLVVQSEPSATGKVTLNIVRGDPT